MTILALSAAISTALVAGVFFTFSTFVMQALARLEPRTAIAAMQSINVAVINPWFFGAFFGAGVLSFATAAVALLAGPEPGRAAVLVGCVLYLVGCIGVTGLRNVPLNDRLARANSGGEHAAILWDDYVTPWIRWNHVRTATSLAASTAFALALITG